MDERKIKELAEELRRFVNQLHGVYLDSVTGFSYIHDIVLKNQRSIEEWLNRANPFCETASIDFQDICGFSYDSIIAEPFCAAGMIRSTQGEFKERNRPGGLNFRIIAEMYIVRLYAFWEDYFRKEYAKAKGIEKNDIKDNFWGDLGKLRNSIVHNKGIANNDVNRCKHLRWFSEGDLIDLRPNYIMLIFLFSLSFAARMTSELRENKTFRIPIIDN